MAQDKVGVANIALSKIGAQPINALSDNTNSARVISAVYTDILSEVLCAHPWSFATKRATLAQTSDAPIWTDDTMTVKYSKPTDLLKVLYFSDPNAFVKIEQDGILSDTTGLKICYIFLNDNPTTYYPQFTLALATRLAGEICFNLVESVSKAEALVQEYQMKLSAAVSSDSQQGTPVQATQDYWENSRNIGGNAFYAPSGSSTWIPTW